MEQAEGALSQLESQRLSLLKNVRYHEDRLAHYAGWNRLFDMFILVTGLGSVTALAGPTFEALPELARSNSQLIAGSIAAIASIIGAIQLVFALARNEHIHDDLRKKFLELVHELDNDTLGDVRKRAGRLVAEEPPTFYAVDALAYNFAARALERPEATLLKVRFIYRVLRHFVRFEGKEFARKGDLRWWHFWR